MICRLCLNDTEFYLQLKNANNPVNEEEPDDIAMIIRKHFDLALDINSDVVCTVCWQQVKEFHTFYLFIEEKQMELACMVDERDVSQAETDHDRVMRDKNVGIKTEPSIDINIPMGTGISLNPWNKAANPQKETVDFEMKNVALIERLNTGISTSATTANASGEALLNSNLWKCESCNWVFDSQAALKIHLLEFHPVLQKLKYKCPLCPSKFSRQHLMNSHIKKIHQNMDDHIMEELFKCTECGKGFKLIERLNSHRNRVHLRAYITKCDICGKEFASKGNCRIHKETMHQSLEQTKLKCPICHKWIKNYNALNSHRNRHHNDGNKNK